MRLVYLSRILLVVFLIVLPFILCEKEKIEEKALNSATDYEEKVDEIKTDFENSDVNEQRKMDIVFETENKEQIGDIKEIKDSESEELKVKEKVTRSHEDLKHDKSIETQTIEELYNNGAELYLKKDPKSIEVLMGAAHLGNKKSINLLAEAYFYGYVVEENYEKAFEYYKKLADMGDPDGNFMVALMYSNGLGVKADQSLAFLHHKMGSLGGGEMSKLALGYRYNYGIGTPRNCDEAAFQYMPIANNAIKGFQRIGSKPIIKKRLIEESDSANQHIDQIINYHSYIADSGDVQSQFLLGQIFLQGLHGVKQNLKLAVKYLTAACHQNEYQACGLLGFMYLEGVEVEKKPEKALHYFRIGEQHSDANSNNGLGLMYLEGIGVEKNHEKALVYFQTASKLDNADASVNLGLMHYNGLQTKKDPSKAIQLFTQASRSGHILAQHYLALLQFHGIGSRKNCPLSVAYLRLVAERSEGSRIIEDAYNQYELKDYKTASKLYLIAAEQGYEVAQANYAYLIDSGLISGDTEENMQRRALIYWIRSSLQGHVDSLVKSGDYYFYGLGIPEDLTKAASIYTQAEMSNSAQATFNLGYMHQHGIGVKEDLYLAKRYYDKAISGADKDAYIPSTIALYSLYMKMILRGQTQEIFRDEYQWIHEMWANFYKNIDEELITDVLLLLAILILSIVVFIRRLLR